MYGSVLWYIGDKCVNKLCTERRKGLRLIWNLPSDAYCVIVTCLSGGMSTLDESCLRCLSFVAKCLHHSSALIRFITHHGIIFAAGVSVMGMNVTFSSARYDFKLVILHQELLIWIDKHRSTVAGLWVSHVRDCVSSFLIWLLDTETGMV